MIDHQKNSQIVIKMLCLAALMFVVFLTSCTPVKKKPTVTTNPIANAKNIGRALGCMFGGCDPVAQDREFQKDFEKIDRNKKSSK
tara:strand:- start:1152 stop:1406 length:255 start_codon:yes stop_codon:yes gene_type:complete